MNQEKPLTPDDYESAAKIIGVEPELIEAVANVESVSSGFYSNGLPKILFERHHFHRLTQGVFSSKYPDISNRRPGGYGSSNIQWSRLREAEKLNRKAALMSASWGKFQIMGFNYELCGFKTIEEFVESMMISEAEHLKAFVQFIKSNGLDSHLRRKDFSGFAAKYNGPNYARNQYDIRMRREYNRLKRSKVHSTPDHQVATITSKDVSNVQEKLKSMNFNPGRVDGIMGPKTSAAISKYQKVIGIEVTGKMNEELINLLGLN